MVLNSPQPSPPFSHLVFPQSPFFPLFLLKLCLLPSGPPASRQPCSHSRCRLWPKRENGKFFSVPLISVPAHFLKSSLFGQGRSFKGGARTIFRANAADTEFLYISVASLTHVAEHDNNILLFVSEVKGNVLRVHIAGGKSPRLE